jgi:hypothetical protein
MPTYKVKINGTAEFEMSSSATSASAAADEIQRWVRAGDGSKQEIKLNWDRVAVLEVTAAADQP